MINWIKYAAWEESQKEIQRWVPLCDLKHEERYAWANSADQDQTALKEQSDQGLQCLEFCEQHFDKSPGCRINYFQFLSQEQSEL